MALANGGKHKAARQASRLLSQEDNRTIALLGRRGRQRGLFRSEHNASLAAVKSPDRAGHLEHLPDRTVGVLHEGDFVGSKDERFGFKDSLGKARQGRCRKYQP
jgi:hypothetical protein